MVAGEIARRAATYRLACEPDLDAEKRARFEKLTVAERREPEKDMILYHTFGSYWIMGEQSARMLPVAAGGGRPTMASAASPDAQAQRAPARSPAPAQIPPDSNTPPGSSAAASARPAFCTSCGSATRPGVVFCTRCGARLAAPQPGLP
jgi:hypothetical protein